MSTITQTKLDKILPGHELISIDGETCVQAPSGDIVATYNHQTGRMTVNGKHENYQMISRAISVAGFEFSVAHPEKPVVNTISKRSKAQGFGIAHDIIQSLNGEWGSRGVKTTVEFDHHEKTVTVRTNNVGNAQTFYHQFQSDPRVIFDGRHGKIFEVTVPSDLVRSADAIIKPADS